MAVISCPECGKDVSSTASACPSCGAPIHAILQSNQVAADSNACPVCGKCLPPRATICVDCDVNVKTGRPLSLPSMDRSHRFSAGRAVGVVVLLTALAIIGYRHRDLLRGVPGQRGAANVADEQATPVSRPAPKGVQPSVAHDRMSPPAAKQVPVAPDSTEVAPVEGVPDPVMQPQSTPPPAVPLAQPIQAPQVRLAPRPQPQEVRVAMVACPLCEGRGRLPEPGSKRWTYSCPLCNGNGEHRLRFRQGQEACSHCNAIGRVAVLDDFRKTRQRYVVRQCKWCGGTGINRDPDEARRVF